MLSLGQLYTDDTNDDDNDNNSDTNDNDNDNNSDTNDNDTRWTNHDCIGSLACMPNEPKTSRSWHKEVRQSVFLSVSQMFKSDKLIKSKK